MHARRRILVGLLQFVPGGDEMSIVVLPGMESGAKELQPRREYTPKESRFDEKVFESACPLPNAPELAFVLQHDAEIAKRILEEEKSIEQQRLSALADCAADCLEYVEGHCLVLGLLDAMPLPEMRDRRVRPVEHVSVRQHVVGHDGSQVFVGNGSRKSSPR